MEVGMGFLDKLLGRDKKDEPAATPEPAATAEPAKPADDLQPHGSDEDDASELTHDEQRLDDVREDLLRKEGGGN
jgi:hypothetical protein